MTKSIVFALTIFLTAISIPAQENETKPSTPTQAERSSKKTVGADSTAGKPEQSKKTAVQKPDSAAQNGAITLKISTDPSEAGLKINDVDYGLTPAVITDLDTGSHVLELSKSGHFRRRVTIQLDSAGADLHFELVRPASVFITSDPEGASVVFDGKEEGTTPFQSQRMRPGDFKLLLILDEHKSFESTVNLKSGHNDTLRITLEPVKPKVQLVEEPKKQEQQISQSKISQPKNKKTGFIAIAFFIFIAVLIGVEKAS